MIPVTQPDFHLVDFEHVAELFNSLSSAVLKMADTFSTYTHFFGVDFDGETMRKLRKREIYLRKYRRRGERMRGK